METLRRRQVLGGLLGGALALPALARAAGPAAILGDSGLETMSGYALADAQTGEILDQWRGDVMLPPASAVKLITGLYALNAVGPDFVFDTRLVATGPLEAGRIRGDLYLVGSGDPHLDTDQLAGLVKSLRQQGVDGIDGRFRVVGTALPALHEIDPGQPDFVGYNPSISGLNLNFNRVYFEWQAGAGDLSMQARGEGYSPRVTSWHIEAVEREAPLFRFELLQGQDYWTVAAGALKKPGGRWLPVRTPEAYAAEVFVALSAQLGLNLPTGDIAPQAPAGTVLASNRSIPAARIVRSMLLYSTNLTAEVMGLTASKAKGAAPRSLEDLGAAMLAWAQQNLGIGEARFVNHSGLSDRTVISAGALAGALASDGSHAMLDGLMKTYEVKDAEGRPTGAVAEVKTGTLNFCSALAGYVTLPSGRRLAFAILATDQATRAAFSGNEDESWPGSKTFVGKARRLEAGLLADWAQRFG